MIDMSSKIKDRKQKEQEQRLHDILMAAKSVFYRKGFLKTTMDEIAYEAAVSKPTIYKFFPTKEDLYFSLVNPFLQECLQDMEEINMQLQLKMYGSGENLIRAVIDVFFKRYKKDPDIFRIGQLFQQAGMLWELDRKTEQEIRGKTRLLMQEMRSIFDNAVAMGLVRDIDRFMLVDILIGSFFGIVQLQDSKAREKNSAKRAEPVMEMTIELFINSVVLR